MEDAIVDVALDVDGVPTGRVRIGRPHVEADGTTWRCDYAITGLSEEFHRYVCGVDALQALVLTLDLMPVLLGLTAEAKAGRLTWHDLGPPWGFPGRMLDRPG